MDEKQFKEEPHAMPKPEVKDNEFLVTGWDNFCRVFELPVTFSSEFCHGGGIPTNFQMVDWFNPVQGIGQPAVDKQTWIDNFGNLDGMERVIDAVDLKKTIVPFLQRKLYIKSGRTYLVLCEFGASFMFEGDPVDSSEKRMKKVPKERFS